ncbi:MAG: hypothetical protein KAR87_06390 [Candidatus Aenigmarchaeota archaeon]|nr:hypothetical protein [Candidatus Aenigmarchaeota archaeon]
MEKGKKPLDSALDYNNIETKILIYEDRVKEWFLKIGVKLKQDNEAGFVILQIATSYIEGNQQYIEGQTSNQKSKAFFKKAMKRIFPEIIKIVNIDIFLGTFYEQVRCGLFHDGMTKKSVTISGEYPEALCFLDSNILINPHKFLDVIYENFENYISELKNKNNKDVRIKFERRWDIVL